MAPRAPWIAAALSVLAPGVGHLYAGAPTRGVTAWAACRVAGLAALGMVVLFPGRGGLILLVLISVAALLGVARDAARVARSASARRAWYDRPTVYAAACVIVLMVTFAWNVLVASNVADRIRVPTDTMAPTILVGERMFVDPRHGAAVKRSELVVYRRWETRYVKRVVGLPGDTVAMHAGTLAIDGRAVAEPYAAHAGEVETTDRRFAWQRSHLADPDAPHGVPTLATWGPIIVPPRAYFVLGDNRGQSIDSRYDGFVADSTILGRPTTVYFSRDPRTGEIRWRRVGRVVAR